MIAGATVEVIADKAHSNSKPRVPLPCGIRGVVRAIDKDGDALIRFEGIAKKQWKTKTHFNELRVVPVNVASFLPTFSANSKSILNDSAVSCFGDA